jgi:hypothetical protein
MSTEQKRTPQKGDWYQGKMERYLCVDTNSKGCSVWRGKDEAFYSFGDNYYWSQWKHLPNCTGWDGVEPAVKTPQHGEWWITDSGTIVYCCGPDVDGDAVFQFGNGEYDGYYPDVVSKWHHEPRCTGFDWIEPATEKCPKYFVHKDGAFPNFAYAVQLEDDTKADAVAKDGVMFVGRFAASEVKAFVDSGAWIEVDKKKALANVVYPLTGNISTPEPKQVEFRVWCLPANMKTGAHLIGFSNEVEHMHDSVWREVKVNASGKFYYEDSK